MNMSLSGDDELLAAPVVVADGPKIPGVDSTADTDNGPPHIVTSTPVIRARVLPPVPAAGWDGRRGCVPRGAPSLADVSPSRVPAVRWSWWVPWPLGWLLAWPLAWSLGWSLSVPPSV